MENASYYAMYKSEIIFYLGFFYVNIIGYLYNMRDLRRVNNERFTVRAIRVLKALNIKTVGKAKEFASSWDGTKRVTATVNVTPGVINEIKNFV